MDNVWVANACVCVCVGGGGGGGGGHTLLEEGYSEGNMNGLYSSQLVSTCGNSTACCLVTKP